MGGTKIRPFKGLKDGKENPEEYLEDIEWAYDQDYQNNEPVNGEAAAAYKSKTHRILFRQNLEEKAREWYGDLDMDVKAQWSTLQDKFKTAFKVTLKDAQTKKFELRVKLHQLEQREEETIADYLNKAEELSMRLPQDDIDVGMATLKGMRDTIKRERVSFECNKDADYSFTTVKRLITAAYNEIGQLSPFDPAYKSAMQISLGSTGASNEELLREVLVNTSRSLPAILQGMRALNTAVTAGISVKPSSNNNNGQPRGNGYPYGSREEAARNVRCFICEKLGHYASNCPDRKQNDMEGGPPAITARALLTKDGERPFREEDSYSRKENSVQSRMLFVHDTPAMAARQDASKAKRPAGITKQRRAGKAQHDPARLEEELVQYEQGDEEEPEVMDVEEENTLENNHQSAETQPQQQRQPLRESIRGNIQKAPQQTKVTKTGKVQELVIPKAPKLPDPIRGMMDRQRFHIDRILQLPLEISLGELLDRSESTVKELAYNLQKATPRYRVRKPKGQKAMEDDIQPTQAVFSGAAMLPPAVTARAYDDDGQSCPLMITAWIKDTKLPRALVDGGSLIELVSEKCINRLKPKPLVRKDGFLRVSLATDSIDTLRHYTYIPVNVEGVEAIIKAWVVRVEVYDLLLGVAWMRRVHCNPHYGMGTVTITGDDGVVRPVQAQITPMEAGLPTIELDDDDDLSADEACQAILDEQGKEEL